MVSKNIINRYIDTFTIILSKLNIKNHKMKVNCITTDPEYSFSNPYSKLTCFILQIYSMEIGSPPLYAEVNRVCREMND